MKHLLKLGVLALSALAAAPAQAEYPEEGPVTFVVPYGPGGGFDTIVRIFAPEVEKVLGATIVPKNIAGASGTRGGQSVARAEADGYTIGIYNVPGLNVAGTLGRDIGFNLDEVTWIANLAESKYAVAVARDSPVTSLKDLCGLGRSIKLSDTGRDSTSSIASVIAFNQIGCEINNITGYGGSNDTMIAVMRGEVDATLKPISSLAKYTDSGDLRLIATLTDAPVIEGVPSTTDLGFPELAKLGLNRVVGGPPDLPADVVETLAGAFKAAAESSAVQEWGGSTGTEIKYLDAGETGRMMKGVSDFYLQYKELLE